MYSPAQKLALKQAFDAYCQSHRIECQYWDPIANDCSRSKRCFKNFCESQETLIPRCMDNFGMTMSRIF